MYFNSLGIHFLLPILGHLSIQPVYASPILPLEYPPYDYGVDRNTIAKRQSQDFLAVTGVPTGNASNEPIPVRLEIRDLEKDQTMWTLYILGLDMMQYMDQTSPTSWYGIMGIHGRPYLPFDNVEAAADMQDHGYCTHQSILFPTWHRPYLALYEQVLHGLVEQIAGEYPAGPVRDRYMTAAANFRIPYWDWAAAPPTGESILPISVGGSPSINIDGPAGEQTIANPLFSYSFKPLNTNQFPDAPFNKFVETMRYPTSQLASAFSQNNLVAQQLDNNAPSFRSRLYNLFTNYHDYATFSNEAWIPGANPSGWDSIESLHDQIHGLTGSGGHMSYIDYSAFDPIFMLHHAMVDRCFAMWQAINPNSYVVPEPTTMGTFTIPPFQIEDVNTPLTPFHTSDGGFWNSNLARSTTTFGYTYPETNNSYGTDIPSKVIAAVNKLYGASSSGLRPNLLSKIVVRGESLNTTFNERTKPSRFGPRMIPRVVASNQYQEWIANILVKKHALSGPFFIHIFLGPFAPEAWKWSFEPNLVGTHSIFDKAGSNMSDCNCSKDLVTGTIPLTDSIAKAVADGKCKSMDQEDVEPYLAQNLQYRISFLNDTEVDNSNVPSLKVSIVSATVQAPTSDEQLPKWGKMKGHFDIGCIGGDK
ncbi:common central domain of tyrosinase-domain-containing protein [Tricladium varicosporioides]|nr:common central domain of tyrosinase-domain-containing protein [Hymenoscyphus varicosporioides]